MFSEISTNETRGLIFSYFALTGSLASLLAPLAGGLLARPAERFELFNSLLFRSFPYLLPSLLAGGLAATSAGLSALYLKETLPERTGPSEQDTTVMNLLKVPGLAKLLMVHNCYWFMGFSWMASTSPANFYAEKQPESQLTPCTVTPIFWYTKSALGGLNLTPREIAWLMAITGVFQAVMSVCANPVLHRWRGTRGVLWLSDFGFLSSILLQPLLHHVKENCSPALLISLLALSVVLSWMQTLAYCKFPVSAWLVCP